MEKEAVTSTYRETRGTTIRNGYRHIHWRRSRRERKEESSTRRQLDTGKDKMAQQGYAEINERVKKSIKSDKMTYIETLAAEARRRLNILT